MPRSGRGAFESTSSTPEVNAPWAPPPCSANGRAATRRAGATTNVTIRGNRDGSTGTARFACDRDERPAASSSTRGRAGAQAWPSRPTHRLQVTPWLPSRKSPGAQRPHSVRISSRETALRSCLRRPLRSAQSTRWPAPVRRWRRPARRVAAPRGPEVTRNRRGVSPRAGRRCTIGAISCRLAFTRARARSASGGAALRAAPRRRATRHDPVEQPLAGTGPGDRRMVEHAPHSD